MDQAAAWRWLLALARSAGLCRGETVPAPAVDMTPAAAIYFRRPRISLVLLVEPGGERLLELYLPLCRGCPERFVVAHLGQSLDGRIAAANGASRWVTGAEDIVHNHRMRALFDAVVVGAGTVRHDDPQLTVRAVPGPHPVRVVLDTQAPARSGSTACSPMARRRPCCSAPRRWRGPASASARPRSWASRAEDGSLCPRAVLDRLAGRGLRRVFVEGGGVTVSRFLAAGCLHRLQITVAPLIIGSGRAEHHAARDRAAERLPAARGAALRCSARTSCSTAGSMAEARAFWVVAPGRGELRSEPLPAPGAGEVLVETLASGISRGTETLVFQGRGAGEPAPDDAGAVPGGRVHLPGEVWLQLGRRGHRRRAGAARPARVLPPSAPGPLSSCRRRPRRAGAGRGAGRARRAGGEPRDRAERPLGRGAPARRPRGGDRRGRGRRARRGAARAHPGDARSS